jgi:hypothetical protein
LAFPHRLRVPESKRKKNVANAAKSALHITTRKTNERRGTPPAIAASLRSDMREHRASEATKTISRRGTDSNRAVREAMKGNVSGGRADEGGAVVAEAEAMEAVAMTGPLDTQNRAGRIARKPVEKRRRNENLAPSERNSNRWRTARTVRMKLRESAVDTRTDRAPSGAAAEAGSAAVPIEPKGPRAKLGRG